MKLTKETLKRIIREELEAVQQEGVIDSFKGFFGSRAKEQPAKQDKKTQEPTSPEETPWPSAAHSDLMGIVWDEDKYPNIPEEVASLAEMVRSYGMEDGDPKVKKKLQSELEKLNKATKNSDNMGHVRIQTDLVTWSTDANSFKGSY